MITLAAPTYDLNGYLAINARVRQPYQASRRGSVTATLDGSVAVYDAGYSDADTVFSAQWPAKDKDQLITLRYLIAYYPYLIACVESGCYRVRVNFTFDRRTVTLSMQVLERLDE